MTGRGTAARRRSAPASAVAPVLAAMLLLAAGDARADVAPTPLTIPFLFLFFVIPVFAILARLVLLGLAWLVTGGRRDPGGDSASPAARKVPLIGFRVRTWLIVLALGLAVVVPLDVATFRSAAKSRAQRFEARSNLGAIRSTEVAYFAEWNVYVGNQPFTPVVERSGNDERVPWSGATRFSILGFAPGSDVFCSYSLEGPDWPADGFTAVAHCDLDKDGQVAIYTVTSVSGEIKRSGGYR